jgi:dihydrofolate reductase
VGSGVTSVRTECMPTLTGVATLGGAGGPCLTSAVVKTQYYAATSVDGFIADRDNSLDWLFQAGPSAVKEDRFADFFAGVGAMAMGASTYEWAVEHEHLLENPDKWRQWYGSVPCWVFTHRRLPAVPGVDLVFARGDVRDVHEEMTVAAGGRNLWLVGGGDLVGQFADLGLLDEILMAVAPVMLGRGTPLLPRRLLASELTLTTVGHDAQFIFLTYQVTRRADQRLVTPG